MFFTMRKNRKCVRVSVSIPSKLLSEAEKKVKDSDRWRSFSEYVQTLLKRDMKKLKKVNKNIH